MGVEYLGLGEDDGTAFGRAASDLITLYGGTPVSQRANSVQSVTYATVASSASFAAAQQAALNSVITDVLEIKATLTGLKIWKGGA